MHPYYFECMLTPCFACWMPTPSWGYKYSRRRTLEAVSLGEWRGVFLVNFYRIWEFILCQCSDSVTLRIRVSFYFLDFGLRFMFEFNLIFKTDVTMS